MRRQQLEQVRIKSMILVLSKVLVHGARGPGGNGDRIFARVGPMHRGILSYDLPVCAAGLVRARVFRIPGTRGKGQVAVDDTHIETRQQLANPFSASLAKVKLRWKGDWLGRQIELRQNGSAERNLLLD